MQIKFILFLSRYTALKLYIEYKFTFYYQNYNAIK